MNKGEVLIKAEGVSKKFCRDLKRSLWYGFKDIFGGMTGDTSSRELRKDEFWAVKNISFEVRRGECLGLVGHNGAGKSTLLKMLNGLIRPDEGRIEMHGRIGALIELGAGFNPTLTGRENVYVNGSVLGFSKKEIDGKFNAIVAFAELEEFIDMPVQNYSSGMKVRLGFAVAAQMEPDILIIDEVLAVGDVGFIIKCINRIDELTKKCAVLFVSHNMAFVYRMCSKLILMNKGFANYQSSDVNTGIDKYYTQFNLVNLESKNFLSNESKVRLKSLLMRSNGRSLVYPNQSDKLEVQFDMPLSFEVDLSISNNLSSFYANLIIHGQDLRGIANVPLSAELINASGKSILLKATASKIRLLKGIYSISLVVTKEKGKDVLLREQSIAFFQVTLAEAGWAPVVLEVTAFEIINGE